MKFLVLLIAAACQSSEPLPAGVGGAETPQRATPERAAPTPPNPPATSSDDVDHTRSTAENNMTGLRPHQGANCPAGLPGSETRIAMTARGVDVTVTSKSARTIRQIIKLAELHARGRTAEKSHPHDTQHGGPGTIGYCPIIADDMTALSMTIIDGGVLVHVNARSPLRVEELQELVKARAARLPGYLSS